MSEKLNPLVATILMVAMTVLLAAAIVGFTYALTSPVQPEEHGNWVTMCSEKVVCYSLTTALSSCFYNNTELMEKYCGASP